MPKRSSFDRDYFALHGHWPEEDFAEDFAQTVNVEPSIELRETATGIKLERVIRLTPRAPSMAGLLRTMPITRAGLSFALIVYSSTAAIILFGALVVGVSMLAASLGQLFR